MALSRVLVVEDDEAIRMGVCDALRFAGYEPIEAGDGEAGLQLATSAAIDLVLLDMMMPKLDGIGVLTKLRQSHPGLPVIVLTARGEPADKVKGLKLGADDYVVKPFGADELLARIEAVLRRSAERPRSVRTLQIAGRTIDFERREARLPDNSTVQLTERECEVLSYLAANPGRAVRRDELLSRVWGIDPRGVQSRTVDMAIARLREHLGDDPSDPKVIVTVRARGYMLASADDAGGAGHAGAADAGAAG